MAVTIPPGYGQAAIMLTAAEGTEPFVTTIGVDLSNAGGDFVAAANQVMDAYGAIWMPLTTEALVLERVLLAVGQDGGGTPSVSSDQAPVQGSLSSGNEPLSVALLLSKQTALLGRRGRGRMFLPGVLRTTDVDLSGIIASGKQSDYQTAATAFYDALVTGSGSPSVPMQPVLLHGGSEAPSDITSLSVVPLVGTMRRRIR